MCDTCCEKRETGFNLEMGKAVRARMDGLRRKRSRRHADAMATLADRSIHATKIIINTHIPHISVAFIEESLSNQIKTVYMPQQHNSVVLLGGRFLRS